MSQVDVYPVAQREMQIRTAQGQLRDYSSRILKASIYPWSVNGSGLLGPSLAAHTVRMHDLVEAKEDKTKEITFPEGINRRIVGSLALIHDDLPFLITSSIQEGDRIRPMTEEERIAKVLELQAQRRYQDIEREITRDYSRLAVGNIPYRSIHHSIVRESGIVNVICLLDQILMAEMDGIDISGAYGDYLARRWGLERARINREWDAREVNGRIGSLPMQLDLETIKKSELAKLWRSYVPSWSNGNLPERVSKIMDSSYSFTD